MYVLTLLADTIRIPPPLLSQPTLTSIQTEIEKRYPNKIIIDVGLILCPYGPPVQIGDGVLVPGDGGAHHQVIFQCVVFRPFVEEVLVGTVSECNEEGVCVNVGGFFDQVFIPAYWMLNPSKFDEAAGVWVWTPSYYDEEEDEGTNIKGEDENGETNNSEEARASEQQQKATEENRFEIEIGAEIRFKVKSVNFTRITTTMKGVQATTTTTASTGRGFSGAPSPATAPSISALTENNGSDDTPFITDGIEVRRRSSSADLSDSANRPAPMHIIGSICEDGLGLISWWATARDGDEDDDDKVQGKEGDYVEDDGDP
jgi:DNA-directed RNA polymerase III subunit RPC8